MHRRQAPMHLDKNIDLRPDCVAHRARDFHRPSKVILRDVGPPLLAEGPIDAGDLLTVGMGVIFDALGEDSGTPRADRSGQGFQARHAPRMTPLHLSHPTLDARVDTSRSYHLTGTSRYSDIMPIAESCGAKCPTPWEEGFKNAGKIEFIRQMGDPVSQTFIPRIVRFIDSAPKWPPKNEISRVSVPKRGSRRPNYR